ncbi:gas vesicle protein GvpG [Oceanobacillus kapialis]|uniref:Gas vesicle protein GvpG n=1 Tax=Oceanobacillus kapialis TaxID=481353 RepID=A0ABW5PXC5_9BACI
MLISGSIKTIIGIARKVQEEVDKELYDLPTIQQKLIQLQMMYELEEIPEEAYKAQEAELLARYEIAKMKEMEQWEALTTQKDEDKNG